MCERSHDRLAVVMHRGRRPCLPPRCRRPGCTSAPLHRMHHAVAQARVGLTRVPAARVGEGRWASGMSPDTSSTLGAWEMLCRVSLPRDGAESASRRGSAPRRGVRRYSETLVASHCSAARRRGAARCRRSRHMCCAARPMRPAGDA
eukprot:98634-Chlamydomonas_euryale.AAC.7